MEADRLKVYRQSLGEVPLGLLERAVRRVIRENVVHVVPQPGVVWEASSATRVDETADGGLMPPRLVAAGVGGSVGCEAGDGGLGGEEVG